MFFPFFFHFQNTEQKRQTLPIIKFDNFLKFFVITDSAEKGDSLTVFVLQNGFEITDAWSRLGCSSAYDGILFTKWNLNKKDNFVKYLYK